MRVSLKTYAKYISRKLRKKDKNQSTHITLVDYCYLLRPCEELLDLVVFAGCGIIVISSFIFNGLSSESFDLDDGVEGAFFLSITRFATTLWAEYT